MSRGLMLVAVTAGLTPTPLGAREPGKKYGAEGCGHPVVLPVSANFRLLRSTTFFRQSPCPGGCEWEVTGGLGGAVLRGSGRASRHSRCDSAVSAGKSTWQ